MPSSQPSPQESRRWPQPREMEAGARPLNHEEGKSSSGPWGDEGATGPGRRTLGLPAQHGPAPHKMTRAEAEVGRMSRARASPSGSSSPGTPQVTVFLGTLCSGCESWLKRPSLADLQLPV